MCMIIRTFLLSILWSFLTVLLSPTHDSLGLAFTNESIKQASPGNVSSEKNRSHDSLQVQKIRFPVFLSDGTRQIMAGFLYWDSTKLADCHKQQPLQDIRKCNKDRFLKNHTLQVLVPGFTYNHTYWDPPSKKLENYSYARFMAQQGYPVLALDPLGTGASSIPDGDVLNLNQSVSSLAQVLTKVRSLPNPLGHNFRRVVLVGHSVGTAIAVLTTSTFPGISDFLVATGWSFAPHVIPLSQELIATALANPYIRFPAPVREELFYFTPSARQAVIEFDNRVLADQFSRGVLVEGLPLLEALALGDIQAIQDISRVNQVKIPVLVQLGRFDAIAPPLLPEVEVRLYSNSPDVRVEILERMGHSFNFHRNRLNSWKGINQWIEERLKPRNKP
jgi:pimeloyl-ACP methyl ester carboxylesterase